MWQDLRSLQPDVFFLPTEIVENFKLNVHLKTFCSIITSRRPPFATVHSHCPILIQIKSPIPIILLHILCGTQIRIESRIGIESVSVNTSPEPIVVIAYGLSLEWTSCERQTDRHFQVLQIMQCNETTVCSRRVWPEFCLPFSSLTMSSNHPPWNRFTNLWLFHLVYKLNVGISSLNSTQIDFLYHAQKM